MMETITLPIWLFFILSFSTFLVFMRVVVFPLWASFWSARTRNVVEEVNPHLQLHMSSFTLSQRRVLADRLACDPLVEEGVELIARERGRSVEKIRREAWRIAWDIVPAFNPYFYFRTGYRMARRCLRSLYKLRVAFTDKDTMADVSDEAAVIFIINHRSNMDYAIANYLTANRTMLSFGVGEWSRVWPIQPLMRMAGGYFVRRDTGDPLYRLLLKRYVQMATQARVPHAVFLEGQLSPDGGIGTPRLGLLSYVTELFDTPNAPDIVFIPVGINYDRTPEDLNVIRFSSQDFRSKGKRYVLLQGIQFASRILWEMLRRRRSYGFACANFGNPVSFGEWLSEKNVSWSNLSRDEKYQHIVKLGARLIDNTSVVVPATPVAVLCRIWFGDPTLVLSRKEMESRFHALCKELHDNKCHVVLIDSDPLKTLDHALTLATGRKLVVQNSDGTWHVPNKMKPLAVYCGNSLSQYFSRD